MSWHWAVSIGIALVAAFLQDITLAGRQLKRKANALETAARRWSAGDYAARTDLRETLPSIAWRNVRRHGGSCAQERG